MTPPPSDADIISGSALTRTELTDHQYLSEDKGHVRTAVLNHVSRVGEKDLRFGLAGTKEPDLARTPCGGEEEPRTVEEQVTKCHYWCSGLGNLAVHFAPRERRCPKLVGLSRIEEISRPTKDACCAVHCDRAAPGNFWINSTTAQGYSSED